MATTLGLGEINFDELSSLSSIGSPTVSSSGSEVLAPVLVDADKQAYIEWAYNQSVTLLEYHLNRQWRTPAYRMMQPLIIVSGVLLAVLSAEMYYNPNVEFVSGVPVGCPSIPSLNATGHCQAGHYRPGAARQFQTVFGGELDLWLAVLEPIFAYSSQAMNTVVNGNFIFHFLNGSYMYFSTSSLMNGLKGRKSIVDIAVRLLADLISVFPYVALALSTDEHATEFQNLPKLLVMMMVSATMNWDAIKMLKQKGGRAVTDFLWWFREKYTISNIRTHKSFVRRQRLLLARKIHQQMADGLEMRLTSPHFLAAIAPDGSDDPAAYLAGLGDGNYGPLIGLAHAYADYVGQAGEFGQLPAYMRDDPAASPARFREQRWYFRALSAGSFSGSLFASLYFLGYDLSSPWTAVLHNICLGAFILAGTGSSTTVKQWVQKVVGGIMPLWGIFGYGFGFQHPEDLQKALAHFFGGDSFLAHRSVSVGLNLLGSLVFFALVIDYSTGVQQKFAALLSGKSGKPMLGTYFYKPAMIALCVPFFVMAGFSIGPALLLTYRVLPGLNNSFFNSFGTAAVYASLLFNTFAVPALVNAMLKLVANKVGGDQARFIVGMEEIVTRHVKRVKQYSTVAALSVLVRLTQCHSIEDIELLFDMKLDSFFVNGDGSGEQFREGLSLAELFALTSVEGAERLAAFHEQFLDDMPGYNKIEPHFATLCCREPLVLSSVRPEEREEVDLNIIGDDMLHEPTARMHGCWPRRVTSHAYATLGGAEADTRSGGRCAWLTSWLPSMPSLPSFCSSAQGNGSGEGLLGDMRPYSAALLDAESLDLLGESTSDYSQYSYAEESSASSLPVV